MTNFIISAEGVVIEDTHKEVAVGRSYRESKLLVPFWVGELIWKIKQEYLQRVGGAARKLKLSLFNQTCK